MDALDRWLRTRFTELNTDLEEAYFAAGVEFLADPALEPAKRALLTEGAAVAGAITDLPADPDARYELLGMVGYVHGRLPPPRDGGSGRCSPRSGAWRSGWGRRWVSRRGSCSRTRRSGTPRWTGASGLFTTLPAEEAFVRHNGIAVLAYERAAAALRPVAAMGVTNPIAGPQLDAARAALEDGAGGGPGDHPRRPRGPLLPQHPAVLQDPPRGRRHVARRQRGRLQRHQRAGRAAGPGGPGGPVLRPDRGREAALRAPGRPAPPARAHRRPVAPGPVRGGGRRRRPPTRGATTPCASSRSAAPTRPPPRTTTRRSCGRSWSGRPPRSRRTVPRPRPPAGRRSRGGRHARPAAARCARIGRRSPGCGRSPRPTDQARRRPHGQLGPVDVSPRPGSASPLPGPARTAAGAPTRGVSQPRESHASPLRSSPA